MAISYCLGLLLIILLSIKSSSQGKSKEAIDSAEQPAIYFPADLGEFILCSEQEFTISSVAALIVGLIPF